MKTCLKLFILFLMFSGTVWAEVEPVKVQVPETTAWIGQRVPFFVELRSAGSFAGAASFDLPQLPGSLLLNVGAPVMDTQIIEGQSWNLQVHEFALFSQKSGDLEIPKISVRFSRRDAFTGPAMEIQAEVPSWQVHIKRPPGTKSIPFLITTETLELSENWEPEPGPTQAGTIFKRTIVQQASGVSGMALVPAPVYAPDSVRVYSGQAETNDKLERGDFFGERRETLTYLLQKSGTVTLPEIRYVWWNPKTEQLQSLILPAVSLEVTPLSTVSMPGKIVSRYAWLWLLVLATGLVAIQWRRLAGWTTHFREFINPPQRSAARKLLQACRLHDAAIAEHAWSAWRNVQTTGFTPTAELSSSVLDLQRHLYGFKPTESWRGDSLAKAFSAQLDAASRHSRYTPVSILPLLNPGE
ncbi:MAG: hypothetical protein HOP23_11965 [Methylococcaceae bacterium]|nr:hypothetical protein [Methylococcaceae bacterium]